MSTLTTPPAGKAAINSCIGSSSHPTLDMASTALLLFLLVATSNIVGAVKVSPPSLHQGGNQTEAEPMVGNVSWFPAASLTDPCNATEPPDNAVSGPPDDMVCGGVREATNWFLEKNFLISNPGRARRKNLCLCDKHWATGIIRLPQVNNLSEKQLKLTPFLLNLDLPPNAVQALWHLSRSMCTALSHGGTR